MKFLPLTSVVQHTVWLLTVVTQDVVVERSPTYSCYYYDWGDTIDPNPTLDSIRQTATSGIDGTRVKISSAAYVDQLTSGNLVRHVNCSVPWDCGIPGVVEVGVALHRVDESSSSAIEDGWINRIVTSSQYLRVTPRVMEQISNMQSLKLNLGCGLFVKTDPGWLNFDALLDGPAVFEWGVQELQSSHWNLFRWRFQQGLGFVKPNTVDLITVSHLLYLLTRADWELFVLESIRVLKEGGVLRVEETDPEIQTAFIEIVNGIEGVGIAQVESHTTITNDPTALHQTHTICRTCVENWKASNPKQGALDDTCWYCHFSSLSRFEIVKSKQDLDHVTVWDFGSML